MDLIKDLKRRSERSSTDRSAQPGDHQPKLVKGEKIDTNKPETPESEVDEDVGAVAYEIISGQNWGLSGRRFEILQAAWSITNALCCMRDNLEQLQLHLAITAEDDETNRGMRAEFTREIQVKIDDVVALQRGFCPNLRATKVEALVEPVEELPVKIWRMTTVGSFQDSLVLFFEAFRDWDTIQAAIEAVSDW